MNLKKKIKQWLYGSCPGFAGKFPYFGTQVYFAKRSLGFLAACDQGVFESDNVRLLTGLMRPGAWYIDVGANIGLMSLPILKAVHASRVVAFEASPNVLPYLRRTIAESEYAERWMLVSKAVGSMVGTIQFSLSSRENSMFDGIKDTHRVGVTGQAEVEMTTLDSWWRDAGRPDVSAVKCDVEGAELDVLRGARGLLAQQRPQVLLEWNRQNLTAYNCEPKSLLEFAVASGYRLYALPHLVPVQSESELALQMIATESFLLSPAQSVT